MSANPSRQSGSPKSWPLFVTTLCRKVFPDVGRLEARDALAYLTALPERRRAVMTLQASGHSYGEIADRALSPALSAAEFLPPQRPFLLHSDQEEPDRAAIRNYVPFADPQWPVGEWRALRTPT